MESYIKDNYEFLSEEDEEILLQSELIKQEIEKIQQMRDDEYDEAKKKEVGKMINPHFEKLKKLKQDMTEVKQKIRNIESKCNHKFIKENWYSGENCMYCKKQVSELEETSNENNGTRMMY